MEQLLPLPVVHRQLVDRLVHQVRVGLVLPVVLQGPQDHLVLVVQLTQVGLLVKRARLQLNFRLLQAIQLVT
jgi:hypothetical protein